MVVVVAALSVAVEGALTALAADGDDVCPSEDGPRPSGQRNC